MRARCCLPPLRRAYGGDTPRPAPPPPPRARLPRARLPRARLPRARLPCLPVSRSCETASARYAHLRTAAAVQVVVALLLLLLLLLLQLLLLLLPLPVVEAMAAASMETVHCGRLRCERCARRRQHTRMAVRL